MLYIRSVGQERDCPVLMEYLIFACNFETFDSFKAVVGSVGVVEMNLYRITYNLHLLEGHALAEESLHAIGLAECLECKSFAYRLFLTWMNLLNLVWVNQVFGTDDAAVWNHLGCIELLFTELIEFYFLDKSDAIVDLGNITLGLWNSESNDASSDFNGDGFKKTKNYFLFYKEKNNWGYNDLFRFKINTTGVNLSGYKFVVKASNTNNFETDKTTADVTYTYQLYSQSDIDAVTFTKATDPTLVKSAYALKEGNKCIFSGASVYDELKTILGVSAKEDIKDFYIRWTVKHTDNTKVDNLTVSSGNIQKRNDFYYIYFNNTGSSIQSKDLAQRRL